ncbi:MAG: DUF72 domain-containing protein [Dehalococcoidia bacterium]
MTAQQENKRQGQDGGKALIGTQGWTGPDWRRLAYPKSLSTSGRLSWYARVFDAVEVNSTFYGIPSHATVRTWRGSVPRGFTFTVKMPRLVTHESDLTNSAPELTSFLCAVRELGDSLGAVLIQLPPWFGPDRLPELSRFLSSLPVDEMRFFLEVRSSDLYGSGLFESLESAGVGTVTTNLFAQPGEISMSHFHQARSAGYIRWLGSRKGFKSKNPDIETFKRDAALWASAIRSQVESGATVFGFFSGDYLGTGLLPAAYLSEQLGQPVDLPLRPSAVPLMQTALIDAGYPRVYPPFSPWRSPTSDDEAAAQGWLL